MYDINCWETKFEYCYYSKRLLDKLSLINKYLPIQHKIDLLEIKKAIYYAKAYHGSQTRQSGELYYSHPLEVAYKIADYCFKKDILITSILHDTIEDTSLTALMIEDLFDYSIAEQVENLTRVKPDRKISSGKLIELLCKNGKEDLLLIKYFDRLHNMETIGFKKPQKLSKTVDETLKKFTSLSIYLKSKIPSLLEVDEALMNLCYQQLTPTQQHSLPDLMDAC